MTEFQTTAMTFLTGSGTTLGTILWFAYLQKREKRDRLIQLNQSIYKEIDRLQLKLEMLEKQRDQFREEYFKLREERAIRNEGRG
jgi:hypothetical protein